MMNQGEHLQKGRCFPFIFEWVCALVRGLKHFFIKANVLFCVPKENQKWFSRW